MVQAAVNSKVKTHHCIQSHKHTTSCLLEFKMANEHHINGDQKPLLGVAGAPFLYKYTHNTPEPVDGILFWSSRSSSLSSLAWANSHLEKPSYKLLKHHPKIFGYKEVDKKWNALNLARSGFRLNKANNEGGRKGKGTLECLKPKS